MTDQVTVVGEGVFGWHRYERVEDRYGFVSLRCDLESRDMCVLHIPANTVGSLIAVVLSARKSRHIGDLFRGLRPETPTVGEEITLGRGTIVEGCDADGHRTIGIEPDDGREIDWMDPSALYRAHDQTVRLEVRP